MANLYLRIAGLSMLAVGGSSVAKEAPAPARPLAFQKVVDCRTVAEDAARLACYDHAVAALDAAAQSKDLVMVDKEQVRAARHSLFGLPLPNFHLFGADDHDKNDVTQIESRIDSAQSGIDGWRIRLEDGTVWAQTDGKPVYRMPEPGLGVVVTRGALGSYFLSVARSPGVKVRRVL
jgi:hypothetical protein